MDKLKLDIQRFAATPPTSGNLIDEDCLYEYHQNIESYYAKKTDLPTKASDFEYTLYDNSSGTTSSITTLNDNISNYKYLEIIYGWDTGSFGCASIKVDLSLNKDVNLTTTVLNNNYIYTASSQWAPSGTNITLVKGEYWRWGTSGNPTRGQSNNVAIFKVLGYK